MSRLLSQHSKLVLCCSNDFSGKFTCTVDNAGYMTYVFVFAWLRGSGSGLRFRIHDSWLAFLFVWHYRAIVQQTSGKLQPWSIWIYTEAKNKLKRGHHSLDKPRTKRLFAAIEGLLTISTCSNSTVCSVANRFFQSKKLIPINQYLVGQSTNWNKYRPTDIGNAAIGGSFETPKVKVQRLHGNQTTLLYRVTVPHVRNR